METQRPRARLVPKCSLRRRRRLLHDCTGTPKKDLLLLLLLDDEKEDKRKVHRRRCRSRIVFCCVRATQEKEIQVWSGPSERPSGSPFRDHHHSWSVVVVVESPEWVGARGSTSIREYAVPFRCMGWDSDGTNTVKPWTGVRMKFIDYLRSCVREMGRTEQVRRGVARCAGKLWLFIAYF